MICRSLWAAITLDRTALPGMDNKVNKLQVGGCCILLAALTAVQASNWHLRPADLEVFCPRAGASSRALAILAGLLQAGNRAYADRYTLIPRESC